MRKKMMCLFLALGAVMLTGCEEQTKEERDRMYSTCFTEVTFKNHNYLFLKICGETKGIVHDPDCPCHNKINDELSDF